jgi:hypothetical protein
MKPEWEHNRAGDWNLHLNNVFMGWVYRDGASGTKYRVCCMWMAMDTGIGQPDSRVTIGHLWRQDFPEEEVFDALEDAQQALFETATVAYMGGFRGR